MNHFKLLFILLCVTIISCQKEANIAPQSDEIFAQLNLQKTNLELKKSSDQSNETINFGDVISTKTLFYLLVNQGNTSAFDIRLNANEIIIEPNNFDIIPSSSNNSTFLPVIQFTLPHVLSPDNVGTNWDFKVGEFTDTLTMSYKYIDQNEDSVSFSDTYIVTGFKVGAIIKYYVKGKNVTEVTAGHGWMTRNGAVGVVDLVSFYGWTSGYSPYDAADQSYFKNEGNISIDVSFYRFSETSIFHTTLAPGDTLNLGGLFPEGYAVFGPTHYIFSVCGRTITNGIAGILGG